MRPSPYDWTPMTQRPQSFRAFMSELRRALRHDYHNAPLLEHVRSARLLRMSKTRRLLRWRGKVLSLGVVSEPKA